MKKFLDNVFSGLIILGAVTVTLTPTWLFLTIKHVLNPDSFWQKFAVYGLGAWFLGGIQLIFLALAIVFIVQFSQL